MLLNSNLLCKHNWIIWFSHASFRLDRSSRNLKTALKFKGLFEQGSQAARVLFPDLYPGSFFLTLCCPYRAARVDVAVCWGSHTDQGAASAPLASSCKSVLGKWGCCPPFTHWEGGRLEQCDLISKLLMALLYAPFAPLNTLFSSQYLKFHSSCAVLALGFGSVLRNQLPAFQGAALAQWAHTPYLRPSSQ